MTPLCIDNSKAHRWILSDPTDGGIAPAYCLRCAAERTFNVRAGEVSGETWGRAYARPSTPVMLSSTMGTGSLAADA